MADEQWYYKKDGQQIGPASEIEMRELANSFKLAPEDLVWRVGMDDWLPASSINELRVPVPTETVDEVSVEQQSLPRETKTNLIVFAIAGGAVLVAVVIGLLYSAIKSSHSNNRFLQWVDRGKLIQKDRDTFVYFDFQRQAQADSQVWNRAAALDWLSEFDIQPSDMNGRFPKSSKQRPTPVTGRWPGKGALRFDGQAEPNGDFIKFELRTPPESLNNPSLSIVAWVRTESTHEGCVASRGNPDDGGFDFYVSADAVHCRAAGQTVSSPPLIGDGTWHLIAVVFDVKQKEISLFVDGKQQATAPLDGRFNDGADVYIGRRALRDRMHFHGVIDEIVFIKDAVNNAMLDEMFAGDQMQ